jgi:N utilization substance protein B
MKRRKAREYSLQFLYRTDFTGNLKSENTRNSFRDHFDLFWQETGEKDSETKLFAEDLISGTIEHIEEIDSIIQAAAEKWTITRMASIDRNILRFSAYELLLRKDIPAAVTINEAIEIAKKYSTFDSAAFINGILDKIAKEHAAKR